MVDYALPTQWRFINMVAKIKHFQTEVLIPTLQLPLTGSDVFKTHLMLPTDLNGYFITPTTIYEGLLTSIFRNEETLPISAYQPTGNTNQDLFVKLVTENLGQLHSTLHNMLATELLPNISIKLSSVSLPSNTNWHNPEMTESPLTAANIICDDKLLIPWRSQTDAIIKLYTASVDLDNITVDDIVKLDTASYKAVLQALNVIKHCYNPAGIYRTDLYLPEGTTLTLIDLLKD